MLKDRFHSAGREVTADLLKEVDQCLLKRRNVFPQFDGIVFFAKYAKSMDDFLKFCWAADGWHRIMGDFHQRA